MGVYATVTSKGQVTIPKDVRDALELKTGDRVHFRIDGRVATLSRIPDFLELAGSVDVPEEWRDAPWRVVREEAWRRATEKPVP